MRTFPQTDWIFYKTVIAIGSQDYEIEANVYLECRNVSDPHSVTGKEEKVTASVEGWEMFPSIPEGHRHYELLEAAILEEVESEYST